MSALVSRLDRAERRARAQLALRQAGVGSGRALPSAEEARAHLPAFARRTFPAYRAASHHELIADHLEAIERGDLDRLLVTMPPRHGKSELCSVRFPAWFLGRRPDRRVIAASYAAALAYRFSRQTRNLVGGPVWPFPTRVADDSSSVGQWDLANERGGYVAAGVGGPITGQGADLLLIDDPIKSAAEADSAAYREAAWEWYQGTAYPRLEPGGAVVVVATRWHADDLVGRLLRAQDAGGDRWTVLHLPALDAAGAPLWPERFDAVALNRIRVAVGSLAWSVLYQGQPTNDETSILKREWWRTYATPPRMERVLTAWDTAYKAGVHHDYSVGATWGQGEHGYYLLGLWRDRVEFPELKRAVQQQAERWQPEAILVEDAASGQSLIQELQRESRLPIIPVKVDRDKVSRAHAVSPLVEAGRGFLPAAAPWVEALIEEHAAFPHGEHDDMVDSTTMALARLAAPPTLVIPYIPPPIGFVGESTWAGAAGTSGSSWDPSSGGFGGSSGSGSGWGW